MNKIKTWFWTKVFEFEYRKWEDLMCCCGATNCDDDYSHVQVNAKDYAIHSSVKRKLNKVER